MKVKDIPIFKQKVLDAMPITQAEVSKILRIDHRDTSRLIKAMLEEHIIKRTKANNTFLLEKNGSDVKAKKVCFDVLLSGGKFSPCCNCELECDPGDCRKLTEWLIEGVNKEDKKGSTSNDDIKLKNIKGDKKQG
jgi:DNA-binding Lrp family transcriptional regulator